MPTANLAPPPKFQGFDANGDPLSGGLLYTYLSGTTTPQSSYTDSTGNTANANPIVLDSRGECDLWLARGIGYRLVLKTAAGVQIWSIDNITAPDGISTSSYYEFAEAAAPASAANKIRIFADTSNRVSWIDESGNRHFLSASRYYAGQQFVFEGDSLTAGTGLSSPSTESWPAILVGLEALLNRGTSSNFAVSGNKIADLSARYATSVYPLRPAGASSPRSYLFVLVGLNNITANDNGATVAASINTYLSTAKNDGFTVVLILPFHISTMTAAQAQNMLTMKLVLKGTPANWDYLLDLSEELQDSTDANLFQGDFVHPSAAGAKVIARLVNSLLLGGNQKGPFVKSWDMALGTAETVGIGTQAPLNKLDVRSSTSNTTIITQEGQAALTNNEGTTASTLTALLFRNTQASAGLPVGRIAVQATASGSKMFFQVSDNYGTGVTKGPFSCDYRGAGGTLDVSGRILTSTVTTFTDADTTPTVQAGNIFKTANTGATSITTFDDGIEGQVIHIVFTDANTTLVNGATLQLAGAVNFVSTANDTMTLVLVGTVWRELGRSVN